MSVTVRVAVFRQETDRLFGLVNRDYHACKGLIEVENWKRITTRVLGEVEGVICLRASPYDLEQHAKAVEAAKSRLEQVAQRIIDLQDANGRRAGKPAVRLPLAIPIWISKRPVNDAQI